MRRRIVAAVDGFRHYEVVDYFEIADAMRDDGIDVAFDLTGFTAGAVMSVLQLRPAPVQINFLGYTGTVASPAIDWMITDPYCVPPDAGRHIVERLLYVEPCYLPNDAARTLSDDAMTRAQPPEDDGVRVDDGRLQDHARAFRCDARRVARRTGSVLWLRDQSSIILRRYELAAGRAASIRSA